MNKYDAGIFSVYLALKSTGADSNIKYYCLDRAKWADGWSELAFNADSFPVLASDQPFYLGYTFRITDPSYQHVAYEVYRDALISRQFLFQSVTKADRMHKTVEIVDEMPPVKYPFKIQYSYLR